MPKRILTKKNKETLAYKLVTKALSSGKEYVKVGKISKWRSEEKLEKLCQDVSKGLNFALGTCKRTVGWREVNDNIYLYWYSEKEYDTVQSHIINNLPFYGTPEQLIKYLSKFSDERVHTLLGDAQEKGYYSLYTFIDSKGLLRKGIGLYKGDIDCDYIDVSNQ